MSVSHIILATEIIEFGRLKVTKQKRLKGTREFVRDILLSHPDWNARQIHDRYLILIGDTNMAVTLNAVQKHVEILRGPIKQLGATGLDSPWSIGSCEKHNIPADIISSLIEYEQVGGPKLTNRQAKWFAKLKPLVFEMSAAKRPLEGWLSGLTQTAAPHKDSRLDLLAIIAYQYAAHEQIVELEGDKHQDTSDLDFEIFTQGELYGLSVSELDSLSSEELERLGGMHVEAEELERRGFKVLLAEHMERQRGAMKDARTKKEVGNSDAE